MAHVVLFAGLPDWVPNLIGFAGTLVLLMMLVALAGFAYKALAGDGIEWPEDIEEDDESLSRGDADDEWDYY